MQRNQRLLKLASRASLIISDNYKASLFLSYQTIGDFKARVSLAFLMLKIGMDIARQLQLKILGQTRCQRNI